MICLEIFQQADTSISAKLEFSNLVPIFFCMSWPFEAHSFWYRYSLISENEERKAHSFF